MVTLRVSGMAAQVERVFFRCDKCGDERRTVEQRESAEQSAVAVMREEHQLLAPRAIRQLRERLGLSPQQLGELLYGIPRGIVEGWERGRYVQNPQVDALLRSLEDRETLERRAARAGVTPAAGQKETGRRQPASTAPQGERRGGGDRDRRCRRRRPKADVDGATGRARAPLHGRGARRVIPPMRQGKAGARLHHRPPRTEPAITRLVSRSDPMSPSRRLAFALAATIALACSASPAHAQFGGLKSKIKQKVAEKAVERAVEKVTGEAATDSAAPARDSIARPKSGGNNAGATAAAAAARSNAARPAPAAAAPASPYRFSEYVLEMTPAVLDRVAAAVSAEQAERAAIPQRKKAFEAAQQKYAVCYQAAMTSPEMTKMYDQLEKVGDNMELYAKLAQQQLDIYKAKCGEPPSQPDYGRLVVEKAMEAGSFKDRQYDVLKERIVPFCKAGATLTPDGLGGIRIGGARIAYVYSKAEVDALQPRCATLGKAIFGTL